MRLERRGIILDAIGSVSIDLVVFERVEQLMISTKTYAD